MRITNLSVVVLDEIKPLVIVISHFLTKPKRFRTKIRPFPFFDLCLFSSPYVCVSDIFCWAGNECLQGGFDLWYFSHWIFLRVWELLFLVLSTFRFQLEVSKQRRVFIAFYRYFLFGLCGGFNELLRIMTWRFFRHACGVSDRVVCGTCH